MQWKGKYMTTLAIATEIDPNMQPDEFYFQLNFEQFLLEDIAKAEMALVHPVTSHTALHHFDMATDFWSDMVQQAYGQRHPDDRLEKLIAKLAKLISMVEDRSAVLREDDKVLASAWSQAAQTYLSLSGRNIGYNDRVVLLQSSREPAVEFGIALLLEQSLVRRTRNGTRLYKIPMWLAELVDNTHQEPRYTTFDSQVIEIVPLPRADNEAQLLYAMVETMTLSRAAKAVRLLSHT
jgi:hypothetical protein